MDQKKLIQTAKKKGRGRPSKSTTKKVEAKTSEMKAKEDAKKLLDEVNLKFNKEKLPDNEKKTTNENSNQVQWLKEQLNLQTKQIEDLRKQLADVKNDDDVSIKNGVVNFFVNLQNAYLNARGTNHLGYPNLVIWPASQLNLLINTFPFLKDHKKF